MRDLRESIRKRLEGDMVGPAEEYERLSSYPTDVYLTGILYPQDSRIAEDEADQLQAEGVVDKNGGGGGTEEVSLSAVKRPASAGLSFVLDAGTSAPAFEVSFSAGRYRKQDVGDGICSWEREPLAFSMTVQLPPGGSAVSYAPQDTGVDGLGLHVRTSLWDDRMLVTVAMVNLHRLDAGYEKDLHEESCFFQTRISVEPGAGVALCPRHVRASAVDDDTRMARLIYRDVVEYAVGHTCAAQWDTTASRITSVATTWVPHAIVPGMSASGVPALATLSEPDSGPLLSTRFLSDAAGSALADALDLLPNAYRSWLDGEERRIADLPEDLREQAQLHIANARQVAARVAEGVELIRLDADVQSAFRLANRAIEMQRAWSNPADGPLVWYPFQLAFILLSLRSVADADHDDRGVADLLWFPTGGGKTEAYLGLIAFVLLLRRLRHGEEGAGVACLMRYTLRLLTTQQFQRAAAMICACEVLRSGEGLPSGMAPTLGVSPFSLGLWVGGDATPNRLSEAADALTDEFARSRPDQLKWCPRHTKARLLWRANGEGCWATCPESGCLWHEESGHLPVFTVDDDLYARCPSLVLGTIDKFAQIARREETAAFFGADGRYRKPDLIIQDELHLIAGPLGTMAGLYETAIDILCSDGESRPKIIASTATIRQARQQILDLFNRETCLFPPPVLDASNSGFALEDPDSPGRLYLGVTTAGRSAKFTLQAVAASLAQSGASPGIPTGARDDFWTTVTYFNSLRELGGALVLMQDDVPKSIQLYAGRRGEQPRKLSPPVELTSRVSQVEIKEILDLLAVPEGGEGCCDALLSSSMISVGVDVPRLGVMIVNGQPKGVAEYIQATSRVGRRRDGPGGLVVTSYNNAKARDRSHFETFGTWHRALYREVEATSVTPFAARAREKGLHAVATILARHLIPGLRSLPGTASSNHERLVQLCERVVERAEAVDPEAAEIVEEMLDEYVSDWEALANALTTYWNDFSPKKSLLISAEKVAELQARYGSYRGIARPTPNSMRNVEPGTLFRISEGLS